MKFIATDNPALPILLGSNDICFPISSKKSIIFRYAEKGAKMFSQTKPKGDIIYLRYFDVVLYNILNTAHSNQYLFGDKNSILGTNFLFNNRDLLVNILNELR
jgi:hypothetical protein